MTACKYCVERCNGGVCASSDPLGFISTDSQVLECVLNGICCMNESGFKPTYRQAIYYRYSNKLCILIICDYYDV